MRLVNRAAALFVVLESAEGKSEAVCLDKWGLSVGLSFKVLRGSLRRHLPILFYKQLVLTHSIQGNLVLNLSNIFNY